MDYPGKVITKTQVTPTQTSASGNWTLDDQAAAIKNNNWPVALVPNPISKSLRFNSADTAYLNRTPATATNRRTWTWSGWFKRAKLTSDQIIFQAGDTYIRFGNGSADTLWLNLRGAATNYFFTTSQVFRDVSSWYHLTLAVDTTQATNTNRVKLYVNGNQVTNFSTSDYPPQNTDTAVNSAVAHNIGYYGGFGAAFDGYMTEINFIDGQALTPSDFGLTNPQTGQWIPKKYTGTYGTNGFYLNFKDATSTTTLGYDYSGNANNWTTNNFSVTAGAGNDSLTDVPTPWVAYNTTGDVGGVIRGNYCTMNPLTVPTLPTISNGNLDVAATSGVRIAQGTFWFPSSGKWYYECTFNNASSGANGMFIGITSPTRGPNVTRSTAGAYFFYASSSGLLNSNGTDIVTGLSAISANEVFKVAVDIDNSKVWIGRGSSWYNSSGGTTGDPAAGANPTFSISANGLTPMSGFDASSVSLSMNFGQRPFAYTPPTGFRSLCTTNLPATAIGFGLTNQGDDYFNVALYTGNGSTNNITGVGFQPDFVWLKDRTTAFNNYLYDAVRGTTKALQSNSTNAEETRTGLTAFGSDGFTLGSQGGDNQSGDSFVAWNWKAGGTGVTNTAGSITSTVSANTTAGFSIVTYTGNGTNGATVGHGLGVAPSLIFIKNRGAVASWLVYSASIGASNFLVLNTTDASAASALPFNNTAPTSSVFSLGTSGGTNTNTGTYVAYCFAAVAGYSAFGSYTGNGSADGPFVYLGFRPRWLLIKSASVSPTDWLIYDTSRNTYNVMNSFLQPNTSSAEGTYALPDALSNGFKIRNTGANGSGETVIYAAFAEYPFQFANAR